MSSNEIIERLEKGELLIKQHFMKFKRGKLERGGSYGYFIGDDTIRYTQFEAVRSLVKEISYELGKHTYKHKSFINE